MNLLPKDFLQSIGIDMDDATYQVFAEHFDETLSQRIIDEIIDTLDETQIAEFNQLQNSGDQLWQWVQANVPELGEIIQQEVDILLGELAENAEHI